MRTRTSLLILLTLALLAPGLAAPARAGVVENQLNRFLQDAQTWPDVVAQLTEQGPGAVPTLVDLALSDNRPLAKAAWQGLMTVVERATGERQAAYAEALVEQVRREVVTPELRTRLIELLGNTGGAPTVPVLAGLLDDPVLQEPARRALIQIPGEAATNALRLAAGNADGAWQDALLQALVQRDATVAAGPLRTIILNADPNTEAMRTVSALQGLGRVGDVGDLDLLLPFVVDHPRPEVRHAAFDAALRLVSEKVEPNNPTDALEIYTQAADLDTYQRVALVEPIVRTAHAAGMSPVTALVEWLRPVLNPDPVLLTTVARALTDAPDDEVTADLQGAFAAEPARRAPPALQPVLLAALADRLGEQAMPVLTAQLGAPSDTLKIAAAQLIGASGGAAEANLLLGQMVTASPEAKNAMLAAYLQIAGRLPADAAAQRRSMAQQALRQAGTPALRRGALALLAGSAQAEDLALVQPYLDDPETREPAALAALTVADRLREGNQRDPAVALYRRLVGMGLRDAGGQAVARLRELGIDEDFARQAGFLTRWQVSQPFPNENNAAAGQRYVDPANVDPAGTFQAGDQTRTWRPIEINDAQGVASLMDAQPNQNVAAYAYTTFTVDQGGQALLKMGSDDGIIVWLNGEEVHRNVTPRGVQVDQDVVPVTLRQGTNTLLLMVLQGGGDWGYTVRVTDPQGRPLALTQGD